VIEFANNGRQIRGEVKSLKFRSVHTSSRGNITAP
jgi:hypothetical protein